MKLLSVPGVFVMALGVVGLAYVADGVNGMGYAPAADNRIGQLAVGTMNNVAAVGSDLMNMSALADETPQDDFSDLLHIEDRGYEMHLDDSVSTEVVMQNSVRKIAFGQVSNVNIVHTRTGIYSSDGLVSRHVQYPGVEVTETPVAGLQAMTWDMLVGWVPVPRPNNSSVITYSRTPNGGHVRTTGTQTCIYEQSFRYCS